jgi:hypothetical protein
MAVPGATGTPNAVAGDVRYETVKDQTGRVADRKIKQDACSQFFAATTPRSGKTPTDILTALAGVARDPGYEPGRLFQLLDAFYPVPSGKTLR